MRQCTSYDLGWMNEMTRQRNFSRSRRLMARCETLQIWQTATAMLVATRQRRWRVKFELKPLAYYATLEHVQHMMGTDGQYQARLVRDDKIDLEVAASIFRDYRVSRTIRNGQKKDLEHASKRLALMIFKGINDWPETLSKRGHFCKIIAEKFKDDSGSAPYSAVTKLCWFLRPKGWTMYDKFARVGLDGTVDVESFYQTLERLNFNGIVLDLNTAIREQGFQNVHAERIIDKFLMIRGSIWGERTHESSVKKRNQLIHRNSVFLANLRQFHPLSSLHADRIDDLSNKIASLLPDDAFITDYGHKRNAKLNLV